MKQTLQQTVDNQTLAIRSLRQSIEKLGQDDILPPHRTIPNWRVALSRERANEPTVCLTTKFFPANVRCECHIKAMLAFKSGDGSTILQICTINAWWQLYKQAIRYGKWRTIPQSPTDLYKSACNGKSK